MPKQADSGQRIYRYSRQPMKDHTLFTMSQTAAASFGAQTNLPEITRWRQQDPSVPIKVGEIHLWKLSVSDLPPKPADYQLLSRDEQARAERISLAGGKSVFVATRVAMRRILGGYINQQPRKIRFDHGAQGKPTINAVAPAIHFNLSHSGNLRLLAVTRGHELGLDVENIKPRNNLLRIAERMFTPDQHAHLRSLTGQQRSAGFYYYWTRLEARIKSQGDGLFDQNGSAHDTLSCVSFIPEANYLACIAAHDTCEPIECWKTYLYHKVTFQNL